MATNGRLRRAVRHARRTGWSSTPIGAVYLESPRGWRSIFVEWDALHRNVRRVIERGPETGGQPRRVSIRRAITVLESEYDAAGNPIA